MNDTTTQVKRNHLIRVYKDQNMQVNERFGFIVYTDETANEVVYDDGGSSDTIHGAWNAAYSYVEGYYDALTYARMTIQGLK